MKHTMVLLLVALTIICSCNEDNGGENKSDDSLATCEDVFNFAQDQFKYMVDIVDKQRDQGETGKIVPVSFQADTISFAEIYDWRSGFYPGILWQLYQTTRNDYWLNKAVASTWELEPVHSFSKHDLGFMVNNSFGKGYDVTKDPSYMDVMVKSANTLISRFNPNVGCIKSWNSSRKWKYPVIIDNMMNLELLFRVTQLTGDSVYWKIACSHADKTMDNHFRDNGSSYHVVDYDSITGDVIKKLTSQGYSDESYWSRGQSWGLYGFTMCYRYTHEKKYLDQAVAIAKFLMSLQYDDDLIPYWDMLSPDIPNTARDASSATIMASAFIELSEYCNSELGGAIFERAKNILQNLHAKYENSIGSSGGFLLGHSTTSFRSNKEVGVPLIYADYYYLEALERLRHYAD